jgi:PIN domain nuclease of toxin-antitoxin system
MKLLLDTHTFIWWDSYPARLSPAALAALQAPAASLFLSVVSVWELVIKSQLHKLSLRLPLARIVADQQANGIQVIPVSLEHVLAVEQLPAIHKDPFDRLLAAQSNVEGMQMVTADPVFSQYPVAVLW